MKHLIAQVNIGNLFNSPFGKPGGGIGDFVSIILSNAVAFAGIILFILLIVGGIMIMSGSGSSNKEQVAKGQKAATTALIGFLVIFIAYWIIRLAESIFGFSILSPGF
jgi:hypothetical protein